MSWRRQIILCVAALAAVLAVFECTDLDLWVQDRFFDFQTGQWIVQKDEPVNKWAFHIAPKVLLAVMGGGCGVGYVLSFFVARLRPLRRGCLLMVLSIPIVPSVIAGLKELTDVYYPCQIQRYGGDKPYVKVLERYPPGTNRGSRGRGWPASHASGGLSLMMLYFACRTRKGRRLGLAVGLAAGWAMGLYQTVNGQHYLSHTFVSMILAWMMIVLIHRFVEALGRSPKPAVAALAGAPPATAPPVDGGRP